MSSQQETQHYLRGLQVICEEIKKGGGFFQRIFFFEILLFFLDTIKKKIIN